MFLFLTFFIFSVWYTFLFVRLANHQKRATVTMLVNRGDCSFFL